MQAREAIGTKPRRGRIPSYKLQGGRLISDDAAGLADFENYLGTQIGFISAFAEAGNVTGGWADSLAATQAQAASLGPLNRPIHWAFPGNHPAAGNGYDDIIAGTFDSVIKQMFGIIAATRPTDKFIFIGLMWEWNFWLAYPHGRANLSPRKFKRLFRYIAALGWQVDSRFVYEFNINACVNGADNKPVNYRAYDPGPEWAEVVDTHAYLRYNSETVALGLTPAQVVEKYWDGPGGIMELYRYAEETDRPFSFTETGIVGDGTANNGTTADSYEEHIKRHVNLTRDYDVVMHGWWNKTSPYDCRLSNSSKPKCAASYKAGYDKVSKPYTLLLEFGTGMVEARSAKDTSLITSSGGIVSAWTDSVGAKVASKNGTGVLQMATRNSLPAVSGDGVVAMVQADVSNLPAVGKAYTRILQCYIDPAATNFTYLTADADAAGSTRAVGQNGGNIRVQTTAIVNSAVAVVGAYANFAVRGIDATIIITERAAYAPTVDASATLQGSINGKAKWSDEVNLITTMFTIAKRILFGTGAASDGIGNRIVGLYMADVTVRREISQAETDRVAGFMAWEWNTVAGLDPTFAYKTAAPTYGGVYSTESLLAS